MILLLRHKPQDPNPLGRKYCLFVLPFLDENGDIRVCCFQTSGNRTFPARIGSSTI